MLVPTGLKTNVVPQQQYLNTIRSRTDTETENKRELESGYFGARFRQPTWREAHTGTEDNLFKPLSQVKPDCYTASWVAHLKTGRNCAQGRCMCKFVEATVHDR